MKTSVCWVDTVHRLLPTFRKDCSSRNNLKPKFGLKFAHPKRKGVFATCKTFNLGLKQVNAVSSHMKHYPLNYTDRGTKDPVSTLTEAAWLTSLFKAAGWRLHLLGYAHLVTAGASQGIQQCCSHASQLEYSQTRSSLLLVRYLTSLYRTQKCE